MNGFYLHFRLAPPQAVPDALLAAGCILEQIFETSYDVSAPLSMSELKHLIKSVSDSDFVLVKEKAIFTHVAAE